MIFSSDEDAPNIFSPSANAVERAEIILQQMKRDHLNPEEVKYIEKWIYSGQDRFLLPGDKIPFTNKIKHYIPTTDRIPVKCKQYRQPEKLDKIADELINKMLDDDLIAESTSPYNSPLLIIPKKPDAQGNRK